jgi:DNA adenine methylase
MKPLLKWAGGKRVIAPTLVSHFPANWNSGAYFEPFIGGAALYLHLEPSRAQISDLNERLIGFYKHVRDSPEALVQGILQIAANFDSTDPDSKNEFYLGLRSNFNQTKPDSIDSSIGVYSLNKLCFNGLYRENAKGFYNVPFGQKKVFPEVVPNDFYEMSSLLKSTEILHCTFSDAVKTAVPGDFVYFDPPYIPLEGTPSFTAYQAGGFGVESQIELSELMTHLAQRGVNAMTSNSSAALCYETFKVHRIEEIQAPRMVSATSAGRGSIKELVIMNY